MPYIVQHAVWAHYRHGQCDDKEITAAWLEAAGAAIGYVAQLEGQEFTVSEARAMAAFKVAPERVVIGLKKIDSLQTAGANVKPRAKR